MNCYYCNKEACAKIGTAKINWKNIFKGKFWEKLEKYVCKKCLAKR